MVIDEEYNLSYVSAVRYFTDTGRAAPGLSETPGPVLPHGAGPSLQPEGSMSDIVEGARVSHANACLSYGAGVLVEIVPSHLSCRPPTRAWVRFDSHPAARCVYIGDLTAVVTPAPMPGSAAPLRLCWPLERAGEPVMPGAA